MTNVERARRALQAHEAEAQETRERIAELEAERKEREAALQHLQGRRRAVLAAGDSPAGLRGERRALTAEVEDLGEEIAALEQIAEGRDSGWKEARRELAAAKRDEIEGRGSVLIEEIGGLLQSLRESIERLDTLNSEHRALNDEVRSLGGRSGVLVPFAGHRDWKALVAAVKFRP